MNSLDLLAKLLATEDLNVVRANVSTASFDIEKRLLMLPQWKNMTEEIEEMLVLHEVGHALFTTKSGYLDKVRENRVISMYANVVEDVRIERKMRERYPGARRAFFIGYKQLNDKDFFEARTRDLNECLLIDKINLYYKVGYNVGVRFNSEERKFLLRIEKAETEEEVIQLATDIYNYSKNVLQEKMNDNFGMLDSLSLNDEDDEDDLFGDSYDGYDEDGYESEDGLDKYGESRDSEDGEEVRGSETSAKASVGKDVTDEMLESKTYSSMEKKLNDMADLNSVVTYVQPKFYSTSHHKVETIVDYKSVLKILNKHFSEPVNAPLANPTIKVSNQMVSYLIKEFEMKKAAASYRYARISKIGQLDHRKLYSYKIKDDLFRQVMKTNDGKKHGMIFLLDWSGSMQNYMEETIEQVINLSMFCHKAQIPFQVFAFSDRCFSEEFYSHDNYFRSQQILNEDGVGKNDVFGLIEFFSNKMTVQELNRMIAHLGHYRSFPRRLELGGTPLNHALIYMADYVGKFIRENAVEKMSFITLTDGESGGLESSKTNPIYSGNIFMDGAMKRNRPFLRDPITKKQYEFSTREATQTIALMSLIRDRYNCKTLGFHVIQNRERDIYSYCDSHDITREEIPAMRISLKSNGYHVMKNIAGRNELYLLDSKKLKVEDGSLEKIDVESTPRQIASAFTKLMNTRKTSRVVLNHFIEQVS